MKAFMVVLVSAVAVAAAVGGAAAAPPLHEPIPPIGESLLTNCGFDIQANWLIENGHIATWTFDDGIRIKLNGALKVQLSNAATPSKQLTVNLSGPMDYSESWTANTWRQTGNGPWLWFGDPATGEPGGIYVINGHFSWSGTIEPFTVAFEHAGPPLLDICELLR